MIKLIEVLRINKPIAISVDWTPFTYDVFEVTQILFRGAEVYLGGTIFIDSGKLFIYPSIQKRTGTLLRLEDMDVEYKKILLSDGIIIGSEYFQILNPKS
jgi:hypothetical protein